MASTTAATPIPGQIVYYYADHKHASGMKSKDDDAPFAAMVAWPLSDRLVNLLVLDHNGTTFPLQSVPLFQGDDKDDKTAPSHCELKPPVPKEVVAVTGVVGQPILLNLASTSKAGASLASVALRFTVPTGDTYTFVSTKAAVSQAFTAAIKPQTLTLTAAQITAGALSDLSITAANVGDVSLAVTATEQAAVAAVGQPAVPAKTYKFIENVTVTAAPPAAATTVTKN
jgi:hypothetical protein